MQQKADGSALKRSLAEALDSITRFIVFIAPWTKSHIRSWRDWRIVIRCSVAAWLAVVFLVITPIRESFGDAVYLMQYVAFYTPPMDPISVSFERALIVPLLSAAVYAASCLEIWIAWLARGSSRTSEGSSRTSEAALYASLGEQLRNEGYTDQTSIDQQIIVMIYEGDFLDWKASAVFMVFSAAIAGALMWFRGYMGPGPWTVALILPVVLNTLITTECALFPWPHYTFANTYWYPVLTQVGINILAACLIFPETLQSQFLLRLSSAVSTYKKIAVQQDPLLQTKPSSPDWSKHIGILNDLANARKLISTLIVSESGLRHQFAYSRIGIDDIDTLLMDTRALTIGFLGLKRFFSLLNLHFERDEHPESLVLHVNVHKQAITELAGQNGFTKHKGPNGRVAKFEAERYASLEASMASEADSAVIEELVLVLHKASAGLLDSLIDALELLAQALMDFRRWKATNTSEPALRAAQERLVEVMDQFRGQDRVQVIRRFSELFEECRADAKKPTQRGFLWSTQYLYSLLHVAERVEVFLADVLRMQNVRSQRRLWLPQPSWKALGGGPLHFRNLHLADEDADDIPGFVGSKHQYRPRDPDFLPSRTAVERGAESLHALFHRLAKPDVLFAFKAAALFALMQLPAHFRSSARFYYINRGEWATVISQVALTQYTAETTFQVVFRSINSFLGAICGLLIWYIGDADGQGSPYGLAATAAVFYVPITAYRLWYPSQVAASITIVTIVLTVGDSWSNAHATNPLHFGSGWAVAWRRFVCIVIGITAAYIWSFCPPQGTSQKGQIRRTYAKTLDEIGNLFMSTLSFAHLPLERHAALSKRLVSDMVAVRAKLLATVPRKAFVKYEWTLRGPWPKQAYDQLLEHQLYILDLLIQLVGVLAEMPAEWANRFLVRTQLADPRFVGDISATFALLSGALRNASPLPTYRMPLIEFSLSVSGKHPFIFDADEQPSLELLCNEDYQQFAVAVSLIVTLLNRLDRVVGTVKELCGERHAVYGMSSTDSAEQLLPAPAHQHTV